VSHCKSIVKYKKKIVHVQNNNNNNNNDNDDGKFQEKLAHGLEPFDHVSIVRSLTSTAAKDFDRKRCNMMVKPKCLPESANIPDLHQTIDSLKIYTTHREHDEPFLFQRRISNWADDESDDE
jgi:hypothetical protein